MSEKPRNIVILSGAGLSVESGVPLFRGGEGIWDKYDMHKVGTLEALERDPDFVHEFCNLAFQTLKDLKPNAAHHALARLSRDYPGEVTLATTNVDELLEQAGARNVVHIHGRLGYSKCRNCGETHKTPVIHKDDICPTCGKQGRMRPAMTFFGEWPDGLGYTLKKLQEAQLFVTIGSSLAVEPVAGLLKYARQAAFSRTCEINVAPGEDSPLFDQHYYGKATMVVPKWVDGLFAEKSPWNRLIPNILRL